MLCDPTAQSDATVVSCQHARDAAVSYACNNRRIGLFGLIKIDGYAVRYFRYQRVFAIRYYQYRYAERARRRAVSGNTITS